MRTLLDTRSDFDAGLLGYDRSCDPHTDSEGLIVMGADAGLNRIPVALFVGPEGSVELRGRSELQAVYEAIGKLLDAQVTIPARAA